MKAFRQGDLVLFYGAKIPDDAMKLDHLTLATGEATGHSHRITEGAAELYQHEGNLYLRVMSSATLTHEQHQNIVLPDGDYQARRQREYTPEGWRSVED